MEPIKTQEREENKEVEGLPVVRRNVAGIDIGSKLHWVCAPTLDGSSREQATFGATTPELQRMAPFFNFSK